jgi:ADP-ribose pyrophosphatase
MKNWKTLDRRTLLDHSKFLKVEEHTVELPDGQTINDWPWVITPDYVNIAAVTPEGTFLCFRQTKYAVEGTSLGPMGGYIDEGEDALSAAKRELLEETGYTSDNWTDLGAYPVDPNRGAGTAYFFLATGAELTGTTTADDLEEQELILLDRAELEYALDHGEIKPLAWAMAFAMALRKLRDL